MTDRRNTRAPLVGSAIAVTRETPQLRQLFQVEEWQQRAWEFYDEVGELRFGAGWVGKGLSKVRLTAATPPKSLGDEPVAMEAGRPVELVSQLAGGVLGQSVMLDQFGRLLTVSGAAWLCARAAGDQPWSVRSNEEVRSQGSSIQVIEDDDSWTEITDDDLLVKVWMSHPRRRNVADAPTRGCFSALRQISLIDQRIDADAVSRLAGAGILVVPSEATFPKSNPESTTDDLEDQLVEAFVVPIKDRSSAAAVVPFIVRVPGALAGAVRHVSFSTPFDEKLEGLRTAAIRRLALGLDMPPETLLGVSDMNHWSAWAMQDEAIELHIEPMMEVICNALNEGYLKPALQAEGLDPDSAMVWYDSGELRTDLDRSDDAIALHGTLDISDAAMLRETGFSTEDAPSSDERARRLAEKLVLAAPATVGKLANLVGLPMLDGIDLSTSEGEGIPSLQVPDAPDESTEGGPPALVGDHALLASADLMVSRALERAGARLRTTIKQQIDRGAMTAGAMDTDCDNVALHSCLGADVSSIVNLDTLLAGAWENVGRTALVLGVSTEALRVSLDKYTRALLSTGTPHDLHRLGATLGLSSNR